MSVVYCRQLGQCGPLYKAVTGWHMSIYVNVCDYIDGNEDLSLGGS